MLGTKHSPAVLLHSCILVFSACFSASRLLVFSSSRRSMSRCVHIWAANTPEHPLFLSFTFFLEHRPRGGVYTFCLERVSSGVFPHRPAGGVFRGVFRGVFTWGVINTYGVCIWGVPRGVQRGCRVKARRRQGTTRREARRAEKTRSRIVSPSYPLQKGQPAATLALPIWLVDVSSPSRRWLTEGTWIEQ